MSWLRLVYVVDSSIIDLSGPLPAFVTVTAADYGDVLWLDELPIEPGSFM